MKRTVVTVVTSCILTFSSWAELGEGLRIGDLLLNPFVEGTYTTDSNIYLDPTNEVADAFLEGIGGLQFHYNKESFVVEGRVFAQLRRYQEFPANDFDDWGERVIFKTGSRETLYAIVDQSFRQVTDYDRSTYFGGTLRPDAQNLSLTYDRSTRVSRELHDIGLVVGRRLSDTFEIDVGAGASWQEYETNVLFDVVAVTLKGELGWNMTDKMSAVIDWETTREDNESFDGSAVSTTLQVGVRRRTTDKLKIKATAGWSFYTRPSEINEYGREVQALSGRSRGGSSEPRSDEDAFSFDLSTTWLATDKITIELTGHTGIQSAPQYPNTLNYITVTSMSAVYDFSDTVTLSLTGSFRRDDYLDPVVELGSQWQRVDERLAGLARLDYVPPRRFLTLFVEGGYEQSESTIYHYNYDQLRLSLGLSFRY